MDLKNYELAEQDYMDGMKYKDIAAKYEVTLNTVKSWKTRYKWDKKGVHTKKRKVCTQKIEEKQRRKEAAETVEQVLENGDLNDKQRLFCLYYSKTFNATKAYQKAYGCTYESAMARSCPLMKDEHIIKVNKVRFHESDQVDGTLINEVSQGKDGAKIKLADRMKALDWMAEHMDLVTPEQAARLEKLKAETAKIRGDDPAEHEDDGFMDALREEAADVWKDE